MSISKSQIRTEMKARRAAMLSQTIHSATEGIHEHLLDLDQLCDAESVFTYLSSRNEPGTYTLIQEFLEDGKRVCVPYINPEGVMQAHLITHLDDLKPGGPDQYNLPVPSPDSPIESQPAVTLVPGLAFTRTGQRLGMGGGYYDRFLVEHPGTFSVGLCYDWQVVDALPTEPHDQRVDMVICQNSAMDCSILPG